MLGVGGRRGQRLGDIDGDVEAALRQAAQLLPYGVAERALIERGGAQREHGPARLVERALRLLTRVPKLGGRGRRVAARDVLDEVELEDDADQGLRDGVVDLVRHARALLKAHQLLRLSLPPGVLDDDGEVIGDLLGHAELRRTVTPRLRAGQGEDADDPAARAQRHHHRRTHPAARRELARELELAGRQVRDHQRPSRSSRVPHRAAVQGHLPPAIRSARRHVVLEIVRARRQHRNIEPVVVDELLQALRERAHDLRQFGPGDRDLSQLVEQPQTLLELALPALRLEALQRHRGLRRERGERRPVHLVQRPRCRVTGE